MRKQGSKSRKGGNDNSKGNNGMATEITVKKGKKGDTKDMSIKNRKKERARNRINIEKQTM